MAVFDIKLLYFDCDTDTAPMRLITEKREKVLLGVEVREVMGGKYFWLLSVVFLTSASARVILEEGIRDFEPLTEESFNVEPQILEPKIIEAIKKLREFIKNGNASNGIPPLDPYFLSYRKFDFIIDDTKLEGFFENVTFANYSDFEVQNVEFKLFPLHFKIEVLFKEFFVGGRYKMTGSFFDEIPVNGIGNFISKTQNLSLFLYVKPNTFNSSLQIKDLKFEFRVLSEKVNYTNEFESEEYLVLDEGLALYVLDRVQVQYVPSLVDMGKMLLNHFLLGYSSEEIMQFILNFFKKTDHSRHFS